MILIFCQVGTLAVAEVCYIGGHEGPTEYWWMRISPEGRRTQVTEPVAIPYDTGTGAVCGGGKSNSGASSSGAAPQAEMNVPPSAKIVPTVLVPAQPMNTTAHTIDTSTPASAVPADSVETVGDVLASMVERLSSSDCRSNVDPSSEMTAPTAAAATVCDEVEVGPEPPTDPRYYKLTEGKLYIFLACWTC